MSCIQESQVRLAVKSGCEEVGWRMQMRVLCNKSLGNRWTGDLGGDPGALLVRLATNDFPVCGRSNNMMQVQRCHHDMHEPQLSWSRGAWGTRSVVYHAVVVCSRSCLLARTALKAAYSNGSIEEPTLCLEIGETTM